MQQLWLRGFGVAWCSCFPGSGLAGPACCDDSRLSSLRLLSVLSFPAVFCGRNRVVCRVEASTVSVLPVVSPWNTLLCPLFSVNPHSKA